MSLFPTLVFVRASMLAGWSCLSSAFFFLFSLAVGIISNFFFFFFIASHHSVGGTWTGRFIWEMCHRYELYGIFFLVCSDSTVRRWTVLSLENFFGTIYGFYRRTAALITLKIHGGPICLIRLGCAFQPFFFFHLSFCFLFCCCCWLGSARLSEGECYQRRSGDVEISTI